MQCKQIFFNSIQSLPLVHFVGLMQLNFLTLKQNVLSFWWCWRENATSYSRDLLEKQTQILTYNWNLSNIRKVAKTLIYRDSYVTRVLSYERFQSFFPVSALHFCFFNYTLGNIDFQKMLLDWSTFASVKSRLLSKNSDRGGAEERKPVSKETASRVRLNFRSTSEPFQLEIKLNLCKQQWRHLWHKRIERRKRTHLQIPVQIPGGRWRRDHGSSLHSRGMQEQGQRWYIQIPQRPRSADAGETPLLLVHTFFAFLM